MKKKFDYSNLRGRILERHGSYSAFAKVLGISRQALHKRLQNGNWKQKEIVKAIEVLGIDNLQDGISLFFTITERN